MAATGVVILCALLQQIYFARTGAWKVFSDESVKRVKINQIIYGVWLLICLAAAAQLYWLGSALAETIWGFFGLVASILALVMQHKGMQREKKELGIP
jgi:hypothetical protein